MKNLKIDSHKLMYHVPRVYDWLKGKNIYPLYLELGLHAKCNHKCIFCAFDYFDEKISTPPTPKLKKFIQEAAHKGIKSILFSGEGEPLLNPDAHEIIQYSQKKHIDVALSTNGIYLDLQKAKQILPYLTWIRFSLNAGTSNGYAHIHRTNKTDFSRVLKNIEQAVQIKKNKKLNCVIGVQSLLLSENFSEIGKLASKMSRIGVDYLTIKPYSQHPASKNHMKTGLTPEQISDLKKRLEKFNTDTFNVIFRDNALEKMDKAKTYKQCYGFAFISHITAAGDMYPCNTFVGKKNFVLGNIYDQTLEQIWTGEKKKEVIARIYKNYNINQCRKSCRTDEINKYLWDLKNPIQHVNFI